jgi:hypothetical protein
LLELYTETFLKNEDSNIRRILIQILDGWKAIYSSAGVVRLISDRCKIAHFDKVLLRETSPEELQQYREYLNNLVSPKEDITPQEKLNYVHLLRPTGVIIREGTSQHNSEKKPTGFNKGYHNQSEYGDYKGQIPSYSDYSFNNLLSSNYFYHNFNLNEHKSSSGDFQWNFNRNNDCYSSEWSGSDLESKKNITLEQQMKQLLPTLQKTVNAGKKDLNHRQMELWAASTSKAYRENIPPAARNIPVNSLNSLSGSFFGYVSKEYVDSAKAEKRKKDIESWGKDYKKLNSSSNSYRLRLQNMINKLYEQLDYQCKEWGLRFERHQEFTDHLDGIHFIQNEKLLKYKKNPMTQIRMDFYRREDWWGSNIITSKMLYDSRMKSGTVRLIRVSTNKFEGEFALEEVVYYDDVKSNYRNWVIWGEHFDIYKEEGTDEYFYAGAKLISINNAEPFLIHVSNWYPIIAEKANEWFKVGNSAAKPKRKHQDEANIEESKSSIKVEPKEEEKADKEIEIK